MAKEHIGRTKATATKTLYAVMKEISRRGGSMPAKDLYPFVEANVKLTEWELEPAGKNKYIRWTNSSSSTPSTMPRLDSSSSRKACGT